jgi:ADP-ribose pyrophosphatase YjhB (NUDIX family)
VKVDHATVQRRVVDSFKKSEAPVDAVIRELKEEVGLEVLAEDLYLTVDCTHA